MKLPVTIPRSGPQDPSTDYQALLRQGLKYCQDLAGDFWTDFNLHDPGVTILQQLCYAITDLSYRTGFPTADIVVPKSDAPTPLQPLYTGDKILTCNPVTEADYRKLLSDRVPGVKNAWLMPIQNHPLGVRGLYEVLVEAREEIETDAQAVLAGQVEQCIRCRRNLGEDIERVTVLKPQPICVDAVIEIGAQWNPVTVLAKVLFDLQNSLIPYPMEQSIEEQFQPDEIWNGPLLRLGALDKNSLRPLRKTVTAQEIANIILRTRGVKRINRLVVSSPPDAPSDAPIRIKPGHVPRLYPPIMEPQESYTISVELEGSVQWHVDSKAVWARIRELEANMRNRAGFTARSSRAAAYGQLKQGENRRVEDYFSIQHQFPVVYGLSKYGIPENLIANIDESLVRRRYGVTGNLLTETIYEDSVHPPEGLQAKKERWAQVRQLRAYLLFFEQLLANYLAQLAHVPTLFSLDEELRRTYFHQPLAHQPPLASDPQDVVDVLVQPGGGTPRSVVHYWVSVVQHPSGNVGFVSARLATNDEAERLRHRILESGRHAGNYHIRTAGANEYRLVLHGATGDFLAQGQERFPTREAAQSSVAGWVTFMTGVVKVKHLLEKHLRIHHREDFGLQILDDASRIVLTSSGLPSKEAREQRLAEVLSSGTAPGNFRVAPIPRGGFRVHLYNTRGELIAEGEENYETEFDAEEGVDRLAGLMVRVAQDPKLHSNHIRRVPEIQEIAKNSLQTYLENLDVLERKHDKNYLARRNNFLNHLLARFGEHFDDDILEQLDLRLFGEKDDFYSERIRWKIEFLRNYIESPCNHDSGAAQNASTGDTNALCDHVHPGLGSGRGQAFDYGAGDGCNAVSGLERRLSLLLGFDGHMDGKEYHRSDKEKAGREDFGFYYMEKQVSNLGLERVRDENGHEYTVPRYRILGTWRPGEPDVHDLHHNFVFSSDDSGILRHLLGFGTNRENYFLRGERDEYHVLFRSPNSKDYVEIHRAIGREEAEHAVSSLIRHLQNIQESPARCYAGERLWVLEHVLLRPRGKVQHSPLRISHGSGIHLMSPPVQREQHEAHLEIILRHGQTHENYRVERDSLGDFIVVLYHEQKPIAATHALPSEQDAAAAVSLFAELIRSISTNLAMREKHVHRGTRDAFYSHRLSVFLPNWPVRFQSKEFKLYAEQMVVENTPAHLAVNCFWLSAYDAREFEAMYDEWKSLKLAVHGGVAAPEPYRVDELDKASEKLKNFIQKLEREQERWNASLTGKQ